MPGRTVSIIVPCYNTGRFLGEALRSLLDQDYPHLEILVVDDGSTDDSAAIAAACGVRCIRQHNQGVSAARNNGIRASSGDYIIFMDADDRLLPGAISCGVRELEARPDCAFVYGRARGIDESGHATGGESAHVPDASFATLLAGSAVTPPATAMFRRGPVLEAGGFDTSLRLCEDHDFYMRLAREAPIHCHDALVVEYRAHPGNASRQSPLETLRAVLWTIDQQRPWCSGDPALESASARGRRHWGHIFGRSLPHEFTHDIRRGRIAHGTRVMGTMLRYHPRGLMEYSGRHLARLLAVVAHLLLQDPPL